MPPQRSQRVACRRGSSDKPAKLVRGQRGYRKHRSGFLNVEPIGSEIEIGRKNTRDSHLLHLPAEIRNRIWSFALGESPIKASRDYLHAETDIERARWNLLRVCRQIYVETAMIPYTSTTVWFAILADVSRFLKSAMLRHVQTIHFGAWAWDLNDIERTNCARFLSSNKLISLRKVKVTVFDYSGTGRETEGPRVQELLETHLPGKEIEICWESASKYFKRWC